MLLKNRMKAFKEIVVITVIIYGVMYLGSIIPFNYNLINPFKKSLTDYEYTDLIFSKFKSKVDFDDRIVLVNVGVPDRMKISKAIQKINAYGVKTIGVDVVFEGDKEAQTDSLLEATIKQSDHLVLAVEIPFVSEERVSFKCSERFCNEGNQGFINFVARPNETIRYYSPIETIKDKEVLAFSSAVVKHADKAAFKAILNRPKEVEQIFYRGLADSYVQINIEDLLKDEFSMEATFKDKIVLMGYMGDGDWSLSARDKFFTPLNRSIAKKALPDMYGLVVHANIISMMLDQKYVNDAPIWFCRLINLLLIMGFVRYSRWLYIDVNAGYWKVARFAQLGVIFLLFLIMALSFYFLKIKIHLGTALVGVALAWELTNLYYNLYVKRQKFINEEKNL